MDGRPVHVFTGEGIILNGPQTREDFADLLPPILVETPGIGENITSPVMGAGTANVFEAAVSIRILDSNSKIIASTTTTATCGSGCRGTFRKRVAFHTASTQDGTIEVFEVSAKNGKPTNIVFIPVTLSP